MVSKHLYTLDIQAPQLLLQKIYKCTAGIFTISRYRILPTMMPYFCRHLCKDYELYLYSFCSDLAVNVWQILDWILYYPVLA
jgi:hypothetical protein